MVVRMTVIDNLLLKSEGMEAQSSQILPFSSNLRIHSQHECYMCNHPT